MADKTGSWPRAVIFDLDGTLIDSAPDLGAALNLVLEMDGLAPLPVETVRLMIGAGVPKLIQRGFRAHGVEEVKDDDLEELVTAFLAYYDAHASDLTKLYPGAYRMLCDLGKSPVKIGLCTNKPTEASRSILRDFHIEGYFDAIIGGTSGFPKKPDPACVNACMSELGSDVSSTVYIGDSETDVATARNAGIPIIAMSYGYTAMPADKLGADHVIDSLSDVPEAIEALTARV